ncbi:winged helix-turn-helix domain-containing protein [Pleionea sp. CnH1-48]|uniref:winged helix-turn-helix domain-containing protein n=1 Tax=Pleionea sp. CnH1-48 TaxID=2954494 RepID=UPI002098201A|nr:tetratricopeptide repeat protein [Pleionea sp. CnH1-48]MCO7226056.1 winged helix-turn-helix domain-containing protein [Pleionea sp. CnH1-48]
MSPINPDKPFKVGNWRVDPTLNHIEQGGEPVVLVPKVMAALQQLALHSGELVKQDDLMAALWGEQIVSDSSMYQVISQLRKALGDSETPRQYIERVSGKGYRLVAPVEQITKQITQQGTESSDAPGDFRKVGYLAIAVAFLVIVLLVGVFIKEDWPVPQSTSHLDEWQSLMVAPLTSSVQPSATAYWQQGLSDALLTQAASLNQLTVVAFDRALTREQWVEQGRLQQVDGVLSGQILQQGKRLRVQLQLVSVEDSQTLWAEQLEGHSDNLFELQDRMGAALRKLFEPSSQPAVTVVGSQNKALYNDYLLARFFWAKRTPHYLAQAEQAFLTLIEQAPDYGLAYVGLCDTYYFYSIYGDWSNEKALNACEPLLQKALQSQPDLGQAYGSQGMLLHSQGDTEAAEKAYRHAIELTPNYALVHMWYGTLLRNQGRLKEALQQHEKAYQLAPLSPIINRSLAFTYLNHGWFNRARETYTRALSLEQDYTDRPVDELNFLPLNQQRAKALLHWIRQHPQRFEKVPALTLSYAAILLSLNKVEEAKLHLEKIEQPLSGHQFFLYLSAITALYEGNAEVAESLLKERMLKYPELPNMPFAYLSMLIKNKKHSEALALFEERLAHTMDLDNEIPREQARRWLIYAELLRLNQKVSKLKQVNQRIESYMRKHFEPENVVHLYWMFRYDNAAEARRLSQQLMQSGWLPDVNEGVLQIERMQEILRTQQGSNREFFKQLELNMRGVE